MQVRVAALFIAGLLVPAGAGAQHWTAEEQEIIDLNQTCWDAWGAADLARVQAICNEHEDARGWWTAQAVPDIGWYAGNANRWMAAVGSQEKWIYWELKPVSVRIFNDTAMIHFWATHTFRALDGNVKTESQKQLNIWQRIDGKWTWIGGMATPDAA